MRKHTDGVRHPEGFAERWRARLHWFWCPLEAEKVWDYSKSREPRTIDYRKQCFVVILDDGSQLFHHIETKDLWLDDDWCWRCQSLHDERVSDFLREAGQFGVQIKGVFYPHSRIDKIIPGGVESWSEKEDHAYATT